MKVLYLASWYPRPNSKNSGVFFKQLAEAMAEDYEEVVVACVHTKFIGIIDKIGLDVKQNKNVTEYMYFVPVLIPRIKCLYDLCGKIFMKKLLNKIIKKHGNFDVIHIQSAFSAAEYALPFLRKHKNIPVVYTEHSSKLLTNSLSKKEEKMLVKLGDRVGFTTAVSNRLADSLRKYIPNVKVIGNMINDFKVTKNNSDGVFTFLCLATLRKAKGIDLLINAFINEFSDEPVRLLIGGEGEYKQQLEDIIVRDEGKHKIELLGVIQPENVVDFYAKGNCFVLPSQYETFGIVYVEAMSCGLPVVATSCGGPDEFVTEENGILIEVDNEKQLRTALRYMYENCDKYNSDSISENTVKLYGKRSICEAYDGLYKTL